MTINVFFDAFSGKKNPKLQKICCILGKSALKGLTTSNPTTRLLGNIATTTSTTQHQTIKVDTKKAAATLPPIAKTNIFRSAEETSGQSSSPKSNIFHGLIPKTLVSTTKANHFNLKDEAANRHPTTNFLPG